VLERVLDVTDAKPVLSDEDADLVESQGVEMWVAVGEVLHGELAEGGLFAGRDGFEWVAVGGPTARFDFDEYEGVFIADDQVDLPAPRPVVALDEVVAAPGQVAQREVLTPRPGGPTAQAPPLRS
jgi:hypothetical protein